MVMPTITADRRHVRLSIFGMVAVALVVLGVVGWLIFSTVFQNREFSRRGWKIASPEIRGEMVNDLLSRHELVGMSQTEVMDLLGPPDRARTLGQLRNRYPMISEKDFSRRYGIGKPDSYSSVQYDVDEPGPFNLYGVTFFLYIEFRDGRITQAFLTD